MTSAHATVRQTPAASPPDGFHPGRPPGWLGSPQARRRAAWAALTAGALLWAGHSAARADMYRSRPIPGGIDPHPWITSVVKQGSNTTVNWYGLEGTYHVERTPSATAPTWTNAADVLASDYSWSATLPTSQGVQNFFRLKTDNAYVGARACSSCHVENYTNWQGTLHSRALSLLNGMPSSVTKDCIVCHTVGYGQPTGFMSATATPNLTDVGCENCHGPGAAHKYGDHDLVHPALTIAAEACGGCHDGSHHPTYTEWTNSAHAAVTPDVASGFADTPSGQSRMMNCGPCHSGATRLAMLDNYRYLLRGYTNVLALPSTHDAAACGQTCAVCHDPHATNGPPFQLRNPIASTNFYTFYTGAATNEYGLYLNTVFATQYVASVQICAQCHNSRGAQWTTTSRPPHHSPQYNMLLGNVGELATGLAPNQPGSHATLLTNQCVACHMQQTPYTSEQQPAISGHTFKVESLDLCRSCHTQPDQLLDFATNSVSDQILQVKAALDYWALNKAPAALRTKYGARAWEYSTPGELSPGGSGPSAAEQVLLPVGIQKARYDLYLVLSDGSYGVHNPRFAIMLLNTAYTWVQQAISQ